MSCTLPETNSSPLKIGLPNRKVVFQPSIFRSYVSFREGIWYIKAIGWDERRPTPRRLISQDTKRPSPRSPFDDCFVDMFFFTGVLQGSISDRFFVVKWHFSFKAQKELTFEHHHIQVSCEFQVYILPIG